MKYIEIKNKVKTLPNHWVLKNGIPVCIGRKEKFERIKIVDKTKNKYGLPTFLAMERILNKAI